MECSHVPSPVSKCLTFKFRKNFNKKIPFHAIVMGSKGGISINVPNGTMTKQAKENPMKSKT